MGEPSSKVAVAERPAAKSLDSWKEIATYLNRDITTVQRWEKREGMPVHRHVHDKRGSVYAVIGELDAWVKSRSSRPDEVEKKAEVENKVDAEKRADPEIKRELAELPSPPPNPASPSQHRLQSRFLLLGLIFLGLAVVISWLVFRQREAGRSGPATQIRSLAVLPLRNLSGDPTQDYLADGITEAIISRLSNIRDLRVTSHTSVMRFKDPQLSVPEIAARLGVAAVVEGSVIKEGNRIRVTAQLIRASTDGHLWSETYDREMRDALSLESEMALAIGRKVEVTVTGEEQQRLSAARPIAPEVYESYLRGNFVLAQRSKAGAEQSISYFQDAVTRDPAFAPAYVGLAKAYNQLGTIYAGGAPGASRTKVMTFVRQALTLDPDIVEAHVLLADLLDEQWHWQEAEAEIREALQLSPSDPEANAGLATWLVYQGRTGEAVAAMRKARALDPVTISGGDLSFVLFHARQYDEAIRESRSTLARLPQDGRTLVHLGFALNAANKPDEAIPVLEKVISLTGSPAASGLLVMAYAHAGRRPDALRILEDLKQRRKKGYVPAAAFVNAYLGLDDRENAFYWLKEAYREQSNILQYLKTHPYFDPIRSDPRFIDLLRRVGLG